MIQQHLAHSAIRHMWVNRRQTPPLPTKWLEGGWKNAVDRIETPHSFFVLVTQNGPVFLPSTRAGRKSLERHVTRNPDYLAFYVWDGNGLTECSTPASYYSGDFMAMRLRAVGRRLAAAEALETAS